MKINRYPLAVLAISASAIGTFILIRAAFGMASMATSLFPFGNALFFSAVLGGPLLMLAAGLGLILAMLGRLLLLFTFLGLLLCAGLLLFRELPGHGLLLDWIAMNVVVTLFAGLLRRSWLCAAVGGTWTGALLGFGVLTSIAQYLSPSSGEFPTWTPIMLLGCLLASGTAILAFTRRNDTQTRPSS